MHRAALAKAIDEGPIPAIHGVVRWRLIDLCQWVFEEFRVTVSVQTLSRELRAMGYRRLSARPRHHAQAEGAIEDLELNPVENICLIAQPWYVQSQICRSGIKVARRRVFAYP
jgi:Winged helix-turn helix